MAFTRPIRPQPTQIGSIRIELSDPDGTTANRAVSFEVQLRDSNNEFVETVQGNLAPHLTQTQINNLIAFLDDMRAKAVAELLP